MTVLAAQILGALGPLVEVGCGKGYWARLLRDAGVDTVAYDITGPDEADRWTEVLKGGPEVRLFSLYPHRAGHIRNHPRAARPCSI